MKNVLLETRGCVGEAIKMFHCAKHWVNTENNGPWLGVLTTETIAAVHPTYYKLFGVSTVGVSPGLSFLSRPRQFESI